jgi:ADP-ribosylglycohydrolase
LIKGKTLNEAVNFAIKDTEYVFFDIHTTEPNGFAPNTLKHVIYWLLHTDSFEEAVLSAVNEGGDTDTIAALVGAIAGIHYGMENIPEKWIDKLKAKKQINNLII